MSDNTRYEQLQDVTEDCEENVGQSQLTPGRHHHTYGSLGNEETERMRHNASPVLPRTPQYEEFFNGTIPCPSCRGSGRIPRGMCHFNVK